MRKFAATVVGVAVVVLLTCADPAAAATQNNCSGRPCTAPAKFCHPQTVRSCGVERGQKVCKQRTVTVCN
jgi:hypothetical protein